MLINSNLFSERFLYAPVPYAKFFEQLRVDVTATVVVEHIERLGVVIQKSVHKSVHRAISIISIRVVMGVFESQICNGCYAIR